MALVGEFTKRLRCEVQGCRTAACVGIGKKHNDYMLCEKHFKELVIDINAFNKEFEDKAKAIADEQKALEAEAKKKAKEEAKALEVKVEETLVEEPKAEEEKTVEVEHEYYVCKYCGEKFDKEEYTTAQFMAHCRKCKKEHEA